MRCPTCPGKLGSSTPSCKTQMMGQLAKMMNFIYFRSHFQNTSSNLQKCKLNPSQHCLIKLTVQTLLITLVFCFVFHSLTNGVILTKSTEDIAFT